MTFRGPSRILPREGAGVKALLAALLALAAALALPPVSPAAEPSRPRAVRIATQSPLTVRYEADGEALKHAVTLAVQELGGTLRRRGITVEVASFDDQGSATAGVESARRIVADDAIVAVVGPVTSDVALEVAPVYRDAGLAMISPSSTHPGLTGRGFANVFRLCGRDDVQSEVAARFIDRSLGARTVHVVHDATTYGSGNAESFRAAARRRTLEVVGFDTAVTAEDAVAVAAAVKARAPDVLYFAGHWDVAGLVFKAARGGGVTARFVGSDGIDSSELARIAGDAVAGAYYTSVAGPVAVHPQARAFAHEYRKKFGKYPEPFAAQAYDAAAVVLEAIGGAASQGELSRATVTAALRRTRYLGYSGYVTFNELGDLRRALYLVMRVNSGDPERWDENRELKRLGITPPVPPR